MKKNSIFLIWLICHQSLFGQVSNTTNSKNGNFELYTRFSGKRIVKDVLLKRLTIGNNKVYLLHDNNRKVTVELSNPSGTYSYVRNKVKNSLTWGFSKSDEEDDDYYYKSIDAFYTACATHDYFKNMFGEWRYRTTSTRNNTESDPINLRLYSDEEDAIRFITRNKPYGLIPFFGISGSDIYFSYNKYGGELNNNFIELAGVISSGVIVAKLYDSDPKIKLGLHNFYPGSLQNGIALMFGNIIRYAVAPELFPNGGTTSSMVFDKFVVPTTTGKKYLHTPFLNNAGSDCGLMALSDTKPIDLGNQNAFDYQLKAWFGLLTAPANSKFYLASDKKFENEITHSGITYEKASVLLYQSLKHLKSSSGIQDFKEATLKSMKDLIEKKNLSLKLGSKAAGVNFSQTDLTTLQNAWKYIEIDEYFKNINTTDTYDETPNSNNTLKNAAELTFPTGVDSITVNGNFADYQIKSSPDNSTLDFDKDFKFISLDVYFAGQKEDKTAETEFYKPHGFVGDVFYNTTTDSLIASGSEYDDFYKFTPNFKLDNEKGNLVIEILTKNPYTVLGYEVFRKDKGKTKFVSIGRGPLVGSITGSSESEIETDLIPDAEYAVRIAPLAGGLAIPKIGNGGYSLTIKRGKSPIERTSHQIVGGLKKMLFAYKPSIETELKFATFQHNGTKFLVKSYTGTGLKYGLSNPGTNIECEDCDDSKITSKEVWNIIPALKNNFTSVSQENWLLGESLIFHIRNPINGKFLAYNTVTKSWSLEIDNTPIESNLVTKFIQIPEINGSEVYKIALYQNETSIGDIINKSVFFTYTGTGKDLLPTMDAAYTSGSLFDIQIASVEAQPIVQNTTQFLSDFDLYNVETIEEAADALLLNRKNYEAFFIRDTLSNAITLSSTNNVSKVSVEKFRQTDNQLWIPLANPFSMHLYLLNYAVIKNNVDIIKKQIQDNTKPLKNVLDDAVLQINASGKLEMGSAESLHAFSNSSSPYEVASTTQALKIGYVGKPYSYTDWRGTYTVPYISILNSANLPLQIQSDGTIKLASSSTATGSLWSSVNGDGDGEFTSGLYFMQNVGTKRLLKSGGDSPNGVVLRLSNKFPFTYNQIFNVVSNGIDSTVTISSLSKDLASTNKLLWKRDAVKPTKNELSFGSVQDATYSKFKLIPISQTENTSYLIQNKHGFLKDARKQGEGEYGWIEYDNSTRSNVDINDERLLWNFMDYETSTYADFTGDTGNSNGRSSTNEEEIDNDVESMIEQPITNLTDSTERTEPYINVYPNPTTGEELTISFNSTEAGTSTVRILNSQYMSMMKFEIVVQKGLNSLTINLPSNLTEGNYYVKVGKYFARFSVVK